MANLHKSVTKVRKYFEPHLAMAQHSFGDKATNAYDTVHPYGTSMVQAQDAANQAEAAAEAVKNQKVMPMADEQALMRARRRSNQRRQNQGRASTILGSDAETLG